MAHQVARLRADPEVIAADSRSSSENDELRRHFTPDSVLGPGTLIRGWLGRVLGSRIQTEEGATIDPPDHERDAGAPAMAFDPRAATILADAAMMAFLGSGGFKPHRVVPWVPGQQTAEPVPAREAAACEPTLTDVNTRVLLIGVQSLGALAREDPPEGTQVVVWLDSIDEVYEHRDRIKKSADVAFIRHPEIGERLELLGITSFLAADPLSMIDRAAQIASRRSSSQNRLSIREAAAVPGYFQPTGKRRRVLFQVDAFDQGGLENVVHYLATGLDRDKYEVMLLVLGRYGPAARRAEQAGL